jgi:flagellar biosynthesis/type III secretory pathway M-ring protein FliF/YscJ
MLAAGAIVVIIIVFLLVIAALIILFIVAREVAWIVRNDSNKRLKDKDKQEDKKCK